LRRSKPALPRTKHRPSGSRGRGRTRRPRGLKAIAVLVSLHLANPVRRVAASQSIGSGQLGGRCAVATAVVVRPAIWGEGGRVEVSVSGASGHLLDLVHLLTSSREADLEAVYLTEPASCRASATRAIRLSRTSITPRAAGQDRAVAAGISQARRVRGCTQWRMSGHKCRGRPSVVRSGPRNLAPFLLRGHAVLGAGTQLPPASDEGSVSVDHLFGVDGLYPMVVLMSRCPATSWAMCGGNAVHDGVGDEHSAEVMRGEPQRRSGTHR